MIHNYFGFLGVISDYLYLCVTNCVKVATNLDIDQKLLDEALKIGGQKSKKNTVNQALKEFIDKRKQQEILSMFGSVVYEPGYDYKRLRKRK